MQCRSLIVVVIDTSIGKSVLFILFVATSRLGVTIVIISLDSLYSNIVDRYRATSIRYKVWIAERPTNRT